MIAITRLLNILTSTIWGPSAFLGARSSLGNGHIAVLATRVAARSKGLITIAIDDVSVAVSVVRHTLAANALIRFHASSTSGAFPIGHTLGTQIAFPTSFAQTREWLFAVAVVFVTAFTTDGFVAEMAGPTFVTLASVWSTLFAIAIQASRKFDTSLALVTFPPIVTCAHQRLEALSMSGITVGASRFIAKSSLPQ